MLSDPESPGKEVVVVNYDTSIFEYTMSMTVEYSYGSSYGSCGSWDMKDLKKMLLGSHKMWKSTCKKTIPHVLEIEPTMDCRGEDRTVQYLSFKLKGAKKIEIYVDDQNVLSVSCSIPSAVLNEQYHARSLTNGTKFTTLTIVHLRDFCYILRKISLRNF